MRFKVKIILTIALFSVSTSSIFARFVPGLSAVVVAFWRMAIASVIIWIYTFFIKQPSINREYYKYYILSGFFLALHFISFYAAVKLTSIANATLLGITAPMFTLLYEKLLLKKQLNSIVFIGFVLAGSGSLIIAGSDLIYQDSSLLGKLYGLLAALFISLVYIFASNLRKSSNTLVYTKYLYLYAAIFLLIISLLSGNSVAQVSLAQYKWLVALGIVPTILGHSLLYYSIKYSSPTIIASIPIGEPIIASILAWFLFSEYISASTLIGGSFILLGVYFLVKYSPTTVTLEN